LQDLYTGAWLLPGDVQQAVAEWKLYAAEAKDNV